MNNTFSIDIRPTWGEFGNIYKRLLDSGETEILKTIHPQFATAMAAAQALNEIKLTLNEEQSAIVSNALSSTLRFMGINPEAEKKE